MDSVIGVGMVNWEREPFVERAAGAMIDQDIPVRFTLFDNGSANPNLTPIYKRIADRGASLVKNPTNEGIDAASNHLLHKIFIDDGCQKAFILEDGCLSSPWAVRKMAEVLDEGPLFDGGDPTRIGIVCCALTAGPPQQLCEDPGFDINIVLQGNDQSGFANYKPASKRWKTVDACDPFFWGIDRAAWEATGEIDAEFWMGWGSMSDYCYRAREHGIFTAMVWDAFAITWDRHVPRPWATNNPQERQDWMTTGTRRMRVKWGHQMHDDDEGWKKVTSNCRNIERGVDGELSFD